MKSFTYSRLIFIYKYNFRCFSKQFSQFDLDLQRKKGKNDGSGHCQKCFKNYILRPFCNRNIHFRLVKCIEHYIYLIYALSFSVEKS